MTIMHEPRPAMPRRRTHELAGDDLVPEVAGYFERPAWSTLADIRAALIEETNAHELHALQGLLDSARAGDIG